MKRFILIAIIALAFFACKDETPTETPKAQSDTPKITFDAENNYAYDVTIETGTGTTFTDTEWTAILTKIETALKTAYDAGGGTAKGRFRNVFKDNVIITVEKNPSYANYKIIEGSYRTLYLNANSEMTTTIITAAIVAMAVEGGDLIGQIAPMMMKNMVIIKSA